ncbi:MAG: hypothetical protein ABI604_06095 [Nitrospirota bacterium]
MIEKPLDRLNYYNGQRLEASDLKLEQEYHIRTRRWINKSLYTPGIARGLDIRAEKDTRFVIVSPGLALDSEGKEILLLEEERICVPGKPHKNTAGSEAKVEGLYLTIRYNEKAIEEERNGCIPKGANGKKSADRAAWGGPALVRAKPLFNWSDALPYVTSGEIVLGEVELDPGCNYVFQINTGVRRYVGAASSSKVRQYALEGERHIDKDNPGKIYFHVRGRQPDAVTLYLRADKFSTLYYTELGWHEHAKTLTGNTETGPAKVMDNHTHSPASGTLAHVSDKMDPDGLSAGDWVLGVFTGGASIVANLVSKIGTSKTYPPKGGLAADGSHGGIPPPWYELRVSTKSMPGNEHLVNLNDYVGLQVGKTGNPNPEDNPALNDRHKHDLGTSLTIDKAGVDQVHNEYKARNGQAAKALTFVDDLQVAIDGIPVTDAIIAQLKDADANWSANSQDKLGNGSVNHPLVMDPITRKGGTGEIKLDFLPNIYFLDGEHSIELSVEGDGNGGRILYNLYVE